MLQVRVQRSEVTGKSGAITHFDKLIEICVQFMLEEHRFGKRIAC